MLDLERPDLEMWTRGGSASAAPSLPPETYFVVTPDGYVIAGNDGGRVLYTDPFAPPSEET